MRQKLYVCGLMGLQVETPFCILMSKVFFQLTVSITAAGFIYVGCFGLQTPISFLCLTKVQLHFKCLIIWSVKQLEEINL